METNIELNKLVTRAQLGDRQDVNALAEHVQPRIRAYIYRSTLNHEFTDDIVQETLLQMLKSISSLRHVESFWPWIYRIASGKINDFFRSRKISRATHFSTLEDSLLESVLQNDSYHVSESIVGRELAELILNAMSKLKHQHRAVIALRCFEDMSYSEVARAVGCSEAKARMSFFRAKQAIRKQLRSQGFSQSTMIMGIALFGKLTAPSQAAAGTLTVTAETIKIGALWEMLATFTKPHVIRVAASLALIAGAGFWYFNRDILPQRNDVRDVHFVVQGVESDPSISSDVMGDNMTVGFKSKGAYEKWMRFPDGPDGAVIRREQRWNIDMNSRLCSWLQDGNANYYYFSGKKTIYITNDPLGALILPTDSPEFVHFVLENVNGSPLVEYTYDEKTGLPVTKKDKRVASVGIYVTDYEYNKLSPDVFAYDWPSDMKVVDMRDQMHQRGWTYFHVRGQIGNNEVSGLGRIPFVYNMSKEHPAWLKLNIGETLQIIDTRSGAYILDAANRPIASFASGSFFKGLGRPWSGIRAYDTIRRDAVEKRIRFQSQHDQDSEKAWVTLLEDHNYSHTTISYDIDMGKDLIETVSYSRIGGNEPLSGQLEFTYLEDITGCDDTFVEPEIECHLAAQEPMGILWPMQLPQRNTNILAKLDIARNVWGLKVPLKP